VARIDDIIRLLQGQIGIILPSFTLTPGYSTTNIPGSPTGVTADTLLVSQSSTETAGQENAFIQLAPKTYSGFPTVSLASNVSGQPDVMQVCLEADATTATRDVWSSIDYSQLMSVLASMNVEIWLYLSPSGTVPSVSQLTTGNFVGTVLADVRHPNVGM
jgi:hypothetical protein